MKHPVPTAGWEHFAHVADMGVRGFGHTMAEAFEQAAIALTAVITDPACVRADASIEVTCDAANAELLFTDWLNALIYEMAVRKMLFSKFDVDIKDSKLKATAWGEQIDQQRHTPSVEAKGATFTELKVKQQENGIWMAQCVIDV